MPIVGMSRRKSVTFGKLRKGGPKPEGRPGQDLDHFRVDFEPQYKHLEPIFKEKYGDKPKQFDWVLVTGGDTPDEAFPVWKKEYTGNHILKRICDGQTQHVHLDTDGSYSNSPIKCASPQCSCSRQTGTLNLMLLDFCSEVGIMGTFMLTTGSIHDVSRILGSLEDIYNIRGSVSGVPFVVGREADKVSTAEIKNKKPTGNRIMVTKSLLYLHPNPEFFKNKIMPLLMGIVNPALPMPNETQLIGAQAPMSSDEFANEIARRNLTREIAWEIVVNAGLSNSTSNTRYNEWLQAIDAHIAAMPLVEAGDDVESLIEEIDTETE